MAAARKRARPATDGNGAVDGTIDPAMLLGDAAGAAQRALRNLGAQVRLPLDSIGTAADSATNLIQRAASVLEEELAAGIVAARRVEGQLLDVKGLHDDERESDAELLKRFRRDAHDVIDILVDVAASAVGGIGGIARRAVNISAVEDRGPRRAAAPPATTRRDVVASLQVPEPVAAGAVASVAMSVDNDGDEPTGSFGFVFAPLVSPTGAQIPAAAITSTPKRFNLAPGANKRIDVQVHVPESTPAGTYSGLLQASRLEQVRAVLVVIVV